MLSAPHRLLTSSSVEQAVSQRLVPSWACSEQIELFHRMSSQYWAAVIRGPLIPLPSNKRCPAWGIYVDRKWRLASVNRRLSPGLGQTRNEIWPHCCVSICHYVCLLSARNNEFRGASHSFLLTVMSWWGVCFANFDSHTIYGFP
jgi:hypothetical protein